MRSNIGIAITAGCAAVFIGAAPAVADPALYSQGAPTGASPAFEVRMAPLLQAPSGTETVSQQNARQSARDYLSFTAFSRTGLIEQLEYEGYSTADATYGVDSLNVDWNDQAAKSAAQYLEFTSFSRAGLIDQLVYEGFTPAQAQYGVSQTGL